jgi:hypothetical protein
MAETIVVDFSLDEDNKPIGKEVARYNPDENIDADHVVSTDAPVAVDPRLSDQNDPYAIQKGSDGRYLAI